MPELQSPSNVEKEEHEEPVIDIKTMIGTQSPTPSSTVSVSSGGLPAITTEEVKRMPTPVQARPTTELGRPMF